MTDLAETIKDSVLAVRQKVVPSTPASHSFSYEGNIIELHSVYDFMGLDFGARNARENQEINKKIKTIVDHVKMSSDADVISSLQEMSRKLGNRPADVSPLDHLYHHVKFSDTSFETQPKAAKETTFKDRIAETNKLLEQAREEVKQKMAEAKDARELQRLNKRMERYEERKQLIQSKIDALHTPTVNQDGEPQTGTPVRE